VATVLSPSLQVRHAFNLGSRVDGIAANPDGKYLGMSLRDRICVTDLAGKALWEVRHEGWSWYTEGGGVFSIDGSRFWSVRPSGDQSSYLLEVLFCGGWQVEASASFEPEDEGGFVLVPHPSGQVLGVWIGAGQDGQFLYWARLADGLLRVDAEAILAWTSPLMFHSSGREFLTTSWEDGLFRRHRYPGCEVIGELSNEDACLSIDPDGEAEPWGDFMAYVSDRRAIVQTAGYRVLLIDLERMMVEGEVIFPAHPTKDLITDMEDRE
jgi:hypothetical protein